MKTFKFSPLVSVILIVVFVLGLYLLINYNKREVVEIEEFTPEEIEEKGSKLVDYSLISEKKYKEPNEHVVFDVSYPQFKNESGEFNESIEDLVLEGIEWQTEVAEDDWQARYETRLPGQEISELPTEEEKYSFSVSWIPIQVNEESISVLLVFSGYAGGAHGYQNIVSFNYSVEDKEEVSLEDLFPGDSDYLTTISEFSRKDLEMQFKKKLAVKTKEDERNFDDSIMPMLMLGTTPVIENFSVFTFTPDSVTFYFAEYQVAPYSMGGSKVTIPRK